MSIYAFLADRTRLTAANNLQRTTNVTTSDDPSSGPSDNPLPATVTLLKYKNSSQGRPGIPISGFGFPGILFILQIFTYNFVVGVTRIGPFKHITEPREASFLLPSLHRVQVQVHRVMRIHDTSSQFRIFRFPTSGVVSVPISEKKMQFRFSVSGRLKSGPMGVTKPSIFDAASGSSRRRFEPCRAGSDRFYP